MSAPKEEAKAAIEEASLKIWDTWDDFDPRDKPARRRQDQACKLMFEARMMLTCGNFNAAHKKAIEAMAVIEGN